MYFKLMNNRPELLTGMRELLEERRHQVVTDAQTVNPVLNGGLEMPVEVKQWISPAWKMAGRCRLPTAAVKKGLAAKGKRCSGPAGKTFLSVR